jgi:hypothetical protein
MKGGQEFERNIPRVHSCKLVKPLLQFPASNSHEPDWYTALVCSAIALVTTGHIGVSYVMPNVQVVSPERPSHVLLESAPDDDDDDELTMTMSS